ncbi:MAG: chorismate synthase [Bacillota bacterium]|jgi:chorismate synthase
MSGTYGERIRLTIFGQSHGRAVGMTLAGLPAGETLDMAALARFMERRAPGRNRFSTPRREDDRPEFLSGLRGDVTTGAPLTAILLNTNTRSADYAPYARIPRPGHADYTAALKYGGFQDSAGGGHFSGRLTAALCVAGGVCLQLLERRGVSVRGRILSVGAVADGAAFDGSVAAKDFPAVDDGAAEAMKAVIDEARLAGDSVGGVVECVLSGLPAGLPDLKSRVADAVFAIPAVRGVSFGGDAVSKGSKARENGFSEGKTDGEAVVLRAAFKPTPSIAAEQRSVDLETMKETVISVAGRHDPCIVPRAVPCVEAAAAVAVYDVLASMEKKG